MKLQEWPMYVTGLWNFHIILLSRHLDLRKEELVSCSSWAISLPSTLTSNLINRASATNGSLSATPFYRNFQIIHPSNQNSSVLLSTVSGKRPTPLNHEAQRYCHQILKRVQNEYVNMCGLCLPSSPLQRALLHSCPTVWCGVRWAVPFVSPSSFTTASNGSQRVLVTHPFLWGTN